MTCGIYAIRNKINDQLYVGQSCRIELRYAEHSRDLRKNRHYNKHLQNSYNKHGCDDFELLVLEECEKQQLAEAEQKWVDHYPRTRLYNQVFDVQYRQGDSNPFFGRKHNERSKNKMSVWKKQHYVGEDNPNYGKQQPLSVRLKMVENNPGTKLTKDDVLEIVDLLRAGVSHAEIAEMKNVSRTVITRISNGTRWQNVTGGPVVPVVYKNGVRQFTQNHRNKIGKSHVGMKYKMKEKQWQ